MKNDAGQNPDPLLIELQLFPGPAFFLAALSTGKVYLEACEHYQKSTFRNRFYIAGSHGPVRLSVPLLKGKHQQMPITEVIMDDRQDWRGQHWKTIQSAYGKSPFFYHYADALLRRYEDSDTLLFHWSLENLYLICEWLSLEVHWEKTMEYSHSPDAMTDQRNVIIPGNTDPWSMTSKDLEYEQVFASRTGFTANLSILDMLFCLGPEAGVRLKLLASEQKT